MESERSAQCGIPSMGTPQPRSDSEGCCGGMRGSVAPAAQAGSTDPPAHFTKPSSRITEAIVAARARERAARRAIDGRGLRRRARPSSSGALEQDLGDQDAEGIGGLTPREEGDAPAASRAGGGKQTKNERANTVDPIDPIDPDIHPIDPIDRA